jgi:hypothetical protein
MTISLPLLSLSTYCVQRYATRWIETQFADDTRLVLDDDDNSSFFWHNVYTQFIHFLGSRQTLYEYIQWRNRIEYINIQAIHTEILTVNIKRYEIDQNKDNAKIDKDEQSPNIL